MKKIIFLSLCLHAMSAQIDLFAMETTKQDEKNTVTLSKESHDEIQKKFDESLKESLKKFSEQNNLDFKTVISNLQKTAFDSYYSDLSNSENDQTKTIGEVFSMILKNARTLEVGEKIKIKDLEKNIISAHNKTLDIKFGKNDELNKKIVASIISLNNNLHNSNDKTDYVSRITSDVEDNRKKTFSNKNIKSLFDNNEYTKDIKEKAKNFVFSEQEQLDATLLENAVLKAKMNEIKELKTSSFSDRPLITNNSSQIEEENKKQAKESECTANTKNNIITILKETNEKNFQKLQTDIVKEVLSKQSYIKRHAGKLILLSLVAGGALGIYIGNKIPAQTWTWLATMLFKLSSKTKA